MIENTNIYDDVLLMLKAWPNDKTSNQIYENIKTTFVNEIDVSLVEKILKHLVKEDYVEVETVFVPDNNPNNPDWKEEWYSITLKGLYLGKNGYINKDKYWFKVKNWIKEPDNTWKVFTFIASPVAGFITGVITSHRVVIILHSLFH